MFHFWTVTFNAIIKATPTITYQTVLKVTAVKVPLSISYHYPSHMVQGSLVCYFSLTPAESEAGATGSPPDKSLNNLAPCRTTHCLSIHTNTDTSYSKRESKRGRKGREKQQITSLSC